MVDIGCGEGALLAVLCEPSASKLPKNHKVTEKLPELYPLRIAGLDIDPESLKTAIACTTPPTEEPVQSRWSVTLPRWDPLDVKIWQGSFETLNPSFHEYECFVSCEV